MPFQPSSDERLPGVSVAISAYNYARFVPDAISSVLAQDYPEFEVIVVDDGSTDNTAEVVGKFGDRVRYIYQKNAGLPAARNTGIRSARFDYIAFLDADDQFTPTMLSRMMKKFVTLPDDFAVVGCRTTYMDSDGHDISVKSLSSPDRLPDLEITCRDFIFKNRCSASAVIVRKAVFEECGDYDITLKSSEDRDMWIRITARKRFFLMAEPLLRYRVHSNSMSRHAARMKKNGWYVIAKAYRNRLVPRSDVLFWLKTISFLYFQGAWTYRDQGQRLHGMRDMAISCLLWPFFPDPNSLNEPRLFRLRAMIRFLCEMLKLA